MVKRFAEILFTPAVTAAQVRHGVRDAGTEQRGAAAPADRLGRREADFIRARDSFYMATVSESGWPYVQHRGGPAGFLRVLEPATIGFADFSGNRQYVSTGNLAADDRVALILVDYARRRRLKILGRVRIVDAREEGALVERLYPAGYAAHAEQAMLISVEAFDWNCSQHITARFTAAEVEAEFAALRARIAGLEAEVAGYRGAR
jgi:predicted pyridoxine 5'-phosphate oxidase superfamily flavin-nucleotide-binding protein